MSDTTSTRIGIVGSGYIARHFLWAIDGNEEFHASKVLTRSTIDGRSDFPRPELLTNSLEELIGAADVVLECSGDPIHAADVVAAAFEADLPVVTMNAEFHVTAGSYFVERGLLSEADGDQPGCIASLAEEVRELGFKPLVYGNMKGFLNENPTREEMEYWGPKQGISLPMVTSFTDGTKIQVEQALVANGLGATIAQPGMLGPSNDDLREGANYLGEQAKAVGQPISDYLLSGTLPHGVFVVGEHDPRQQAALEYFKMGEGPYYTVIKNNIFVHLEILKTIKRVVREGRPLLNNSAQPTISVASIAKRPLAAGLAIEQAIGSFDVRGSTVCIADAAGHVPVGLLANARLTRDVDAGEMVTFDDVELPESLALTAWQETERRVLESARASA